MSTPRIIGKAVKAAISDSSPAESARKLTSVPTFGNGMVVYIFNYGYYGQGADSEPVSADIAHDAHQKDGHQASEQSKTLIDGMIISVGQLGAAREALAAGTIRSPLANALRSVEV